MTEAKPKFLDISLVGNSRSASNAPSHTFSGLENALLAAVSRPARLVEPFAWVEHIPFAFFLVEAIKPSLLVELGVHTANSLSAFCQAVNQQGINCKSYGVDTWEGDPHATFYEKNVYEDVSRFFKENYGSFSELIRSRFDQAVSSFSDASIDLLHIDGFHSYEAAADDFYSWLPKMSERGVVLLHDTAVRRNGFGVWKLLEELSQKYPCFEFFHGHGLGVVWVGKQSAKLFTEFSEKDQQIVRDTFSRLGKNLLEEASAKIKFDRAQAIQNEKMALLDSPAEWNSQFTLFNGENYTEELTQRTGFQGRNIQLRYSIPASSENRKARLWLVNTRHKGKIDNAWLESPDGTKQKIGLMLGTEQISFGQTFYIEDLSQGLILDIAAGDKVQTTEMQTVVIEGQLESVGGFSEVVMQKEAFRQSKEELQKGITQIEDELALIKSKNQQLLARNKVLSDEEKDLIEKLRISQQNSKNSTKEYDAILVVNADLNKQIESLNNQNSSLSKTLESVLTSKSWKITAPLRALFGNKA